MRRVKLFGLALVAVFASAAALSSSAFALELPENLPTSTETRTWTGESDGTGVTAEPEFKTLNAAKVELIVKCEKATAEGTEESKKPLGLFHIHFLGCHTELSPGTIVKCTDLNHLTAGEILVLGTWHLVWDRENGKEFKELTTGVLFLVEPVHFTCSIVLLEVKGEQLCLHLKPTEENTTHLFHCIANATNHWEQSEEWCKKDVGGVCTEPVKPLLLTSVSHEAFGPSSELALGSTTYKVKLFADV
jgi:hypothetical protein